jgi:sulfur-carrier protein
MGLSACRPEAHGLIAVRLVYFARVREAIGFDGETVDLPDTVTSVADCISWLTDKGAQYATAFSDHDRLRFALDQHMVGPEALLGGASELAIFPPVTGG